jgi:hypothetical protein
LQAGLASASNKSSGRSTVTDRQTMTDRGRSDADAAAALCTMCFWFPDFAAAMFEIDFVISSLVSSSISSDLMHHISPLTPWHEKCTPANSPFPSQTQTQTQTQTARIKQLRLSRLFGIISSSHTDASAKTLLQWLPHSRLAS